VPLALAQLFRALGLQSGDHIALMLENHPRYFEICWGAHRAGLIYTAMSTRLTEAEVSYIVNDCGAKAVVASLANKVFGGDDSSKGSKGGKPAWANAGDDDDNV
jgi:long-chain acyl-CoA synthetase